jgi:hypothetical protein
MSNCLFAFPDRTIPNAYVTPVLSGGAWLSALPLANLQDRELTLPARSTNALASSTVIDIDLGTLRDTRVLALLRHNCSLAATVRFSFWGDLGHTQLIHDTGALPVWLPFYPPGTLNWGHVSLWDGKITPEDQDGYQFDFIRSLPSAVIARYVRVEISDPDNPAGYLELSRCILAPAWEPRTAMSYGNSVGWDSNANVSRAIGGRRYVDEQAMWRVASCTLEHVDPGVASACVMELQRRLGKSGELIFVYDPAADSQAEWQRSFLASLDELPPLENPYFNANTAGFKLVEVL